MSPKPDTIEQKRVSAWFRLPQAERDRRLEVARRWRLTRLAEDRAGWRKKWNLSARRSYAKNRAVQLPRYNQRDRHDIANLSDRYVRRLLRTTGVPAGQITQEMISEKRNQIRLRRIQQPILKIERDARTAEKAAMREKRWMTMTSPAARPSAP